MMALRRQALLRVAYFVFFVIVLYTFFETIGKIFYSVKSRNFFSIPSKQYPSEEILDSLFLDETQCKATFPDLTKEIDYAVARGPFNLKKEPDDFTGMIQGKIKDGKLYILTHEHRPNRDMLFERTAVLHQLHRAILTSPNPLPNIAFAFTILDAPWKNAWSFARSNDPNIKGNYWVMPHFAFWSWPRPFIDTMDSALSRIFAIEESTPWSEKVDKVVWRGTAHFNSVGNLYLRPNLLQMTKGKDWADVEDLKWRTNSEQANNSLLIEDFCKYKYIIYTEGITYSGRLPFHQACASVIITPPLTYLLHTTHLIRPLFSSSLPFSPATSASAKPATNPRWPRSYPASQANIVFVAHDWSDLEQTLMWLRANPEIAEGIGRRQREDIMDAGYLSPAAEVCYWRSLIRGWSTVANESKEWEEEDGMRWETFSLKGKIGWD